MAKLRKGVAYRRCGNPKRAYTRKSKYRAKSFIRTNPPSKVVRYDMGIVRNDFPVHVYLISDDTLQIRHNAIESARMISNRLMEEQVGKTNYHMKIRMFPHHVLRENPLASGAGADRMSTGMARSFGKPIGIAARVKRGQVIFQIDTFKEHLEKAKLAANKAKQKLPCRCMIRIENAEKAVKQAA